MSPEQIDLLTDLRAAYYALATRSRRGFRRPGRNRPAGCTAHQARLRAWHELSVFVNGLDPEQAARYGVVR